MIYLTRCLAESIVSGVYPYRKAVKDVSPKIGTIECHCVDAEAGIFIYLKMGNEFKKTVSNPEHFLY